MPPVRHASIDVLSSVSGQVDCPGLLDDHDDFDPGKQLQFLKRAHLTHLTTLAQMFGSIFPLSFVLTLLPLYHSTELLSQSIASFLLPLFQTRFPGVTIRRDNLKLDDAQIPDLKGCESGILPVTTLVQPNTENVLLCLYVCEPQEHQEPLEPGRHRTPELDVTFRSAMILIGSATDASVVRDILLDAYSTVHPYLDDEVKAAEAAKKGAGGWIICGHSVMLYDLPSTQIVPATTPEERAKRNALALTRAMVQQLYARKPKPVRVAFIQAYFCLSDHFGWPLPFGSLNHLLSELCKETELLAIFEGGRAVLTVAGVQTSTAPAVILRLRAVLEGDRGAQLLKDYIQRIAAVVQAVSREELLEQRRKLKEGSRKKPSSAYTAQDGGASSSNNNTQEKILMMKRQLQELQGENEEMERIVGSDVEGSVADGSDVYSDSGSFYSSASGSFVSGSSYMSFSGSDNAASLERGRSGSKTRTARSPVRRGDRNRGAATTATNRRARRPSSPPPTKDTRPPPPKYTPTDPNPNASSSNRRRGRPSSPPRLLSRDRSPRRGNKRSPPRRSSPPPPTSSRRNRSRSGGGRVDRWQRRSLSRGRRRSPKRRSSRRSGGGGRRRSRSR